jgi:hypothetical protein
LPSRLLQAAGKDYCTPIQWNAGARNKMDHSIEYRKPVIVDLGSVMEVIRGTLIKGHTGIIEAIHWRILPAYDLDD